MPFLETENNNLNSNYRVQIIGCGAVGSYLAYELSKSNTDIFFVDHRQNEKFYNTEHEFNILGNWYTFKKRSNISTNCHFTFVCVKSYDFKLEYLPSLVKTDSQVVFIQNGFSLYSKIEKSSERFIFANLASLDVSLNRKTLLIKSQNSKFLYAENRTVPISQKINNLFKESSIEVKNFESYLEVLQAKYPRWLLTCLLTITFCDTLDIALKKVDTDKFNLVKQDLVVLLKEVLNLNFNDLEIQNQLKNLPPDFTPSAYRDYIKGKESEFFVEINYLIAKGKEKRVPISNLTSWLEEMNCLNQ